MSLPANVQLVIYGAGSLGREILEYSGRRPRATVDVPVKRAMWLDDVLPEGTLIDGLHVGGIADLAKTYAYNEHIPEGETPAFIIIAIADPTARARVATRFLASRIRIATLRFSPSVGRCEGGARDAIVLPNTLVSTNAKAGRGLLMNVYSSIGHDCKLGSYVTLGPYVGLSGGVTVGDRVTFGVGAKVIPGVTIGSDVEVGAGSIVMKDIPSNEKWAGYPARRIG